MNFKADGSFVQTTTTEATFMGQTTTDTETEEGTYSINGSTITLCDSDGDCDDGELLSPEIILPSLPRRMRPTVVIPNSEGFASSLVA
jgi:hypothetical protein